MQLSALDARFQQTKWVVEVSMIAVAVVFAWTTHHLLVSLNRYLGTSDGAETSLRLLAADCHLVVFPGIWSSRALLGNHPKALVRARAG